MTTPPRVVPPAVAMTVPATAALASAVFTAAEIDQVLPYLVGTFRDVDLDPETTADVVTMTHEDVRHSLRQPATTGVELDVTIQDATVTVDISEHSQAGGRAGAGAPAGPVTPSGQAGWQDAIADRVATRRFTVTGDRPAPAATPPATGAGQQGWSASFAVTADDDGVVDGREHMHRLLRRRHLVPTVAAAAEALTGVLIAALQDCLDHPDVVIDVAVDAGSVTVCGSGTLERGTLLTVPAAAHVGTVPELPGLVWGTRRRRDRAGLWFALPRFGDPDAAAAPEPREQNPSAADVVLAETVLTAARSATAPGVPAPSGARVGAR